MNLFVVPTSYAKGEPAALVSRKTTPPSVLARTSIRTTSPVLRKVASGARKKTIEY